MSIIRIEHIIYRYGNEFHSCFRGRKPRRLTSAGPWAVTDAPKSVDIMLFYFVFLQSCRCVISMCNIRRKNVETRVARIYARDFPTVPQKIFRVSIAPAMIIMSSSSLELTRAARFAITSRTVIFTRRNDSDEINRRGRPLPSRRCTIFRNGRRFRLNDG
jgi:hypothetical protein